LPASASLRFYPEGNISRRARFEQYREAWHLFQHTQKNDCHPPSVPDAPSVSSADWESEECASKGSALESDGSATDNNCHPEQNEPPASDESCHPKGSEGPTLKNRCHPERSEGPAVPESEQTPNPAPAPESPMERMMSQWAKRVDTLYNRKR
jgi:hypothetical protein